MKRLMSLILLSVGLLILAACTGEDETQRTPSPTVTAAAGSTTEPEPTGTPASPQTPEPVPTREPTSGSTPGVPNTTATPIPSTTTEPPTPEPTARPESTTAPQPTEAPKQTVAPEATAVPDPTPVPTPVPAPAFVTGSDSAKLVASDAAQGKKFGTYLAIDGDTIIAGAPADFSKGTNSGAALVFTKADGVWTEQAKLIGTDTGPEDLFGQVVGLSGDTTVIGAPGDTPAGTGSGSAYVFIQAGGAWIVEAKLAPTDAGPGDRFGWSAAISGDTIIIGAPNDTPLGTDSGSAYVFIRTGGTWIVEAKLTGSGIAASGMFGWSVAIDGDTVAVGALGDISNGVDSGATYVFTRADGIWTEQAKLTANDAFAAANFGRSVALSGDTLAIGAPGNADKGPNTGATYVFSRGDEAWTQQAKLTASDASTTDNFGWSVSISGNTVAAGAFGDAAKGLDAGSVYIYTRNGTSWTEQANLTATGAAVNHKLGTSVSISGNNLVAGAPGDFQKGTDTGAAHVFTAQIQ